MIPIKHSVPGAISIRLVTLYGKDARLLTPHAALMVAASFASPPSTQHAGPP